MAGEEKTKTPEEQYEESMKEKYESYIEEYVKNNALIPGIKSKEQLLTDEVRGKIPEVENFLNSDWAKKQPWYGSYELAQSGDFSQFEKVDPLARHFLASKYMMECISDANKREILFAPEEHEADLERMLQEEKHNPLFRLGCSQLSRFNDWVDIVPGHNITYRMVNETEANKDSRYLKSKDPEKKGRIMEFHEIFREYDDRMTEMIMEDTLRPLSDTQLRNVRAATGSQQKAEEMVHANVEKQVQLAKMMFLAQIGDTYLTTSTLNEQQQTVSKKKEPLHRSVASMVSHCSRTGIVLPTNHDDKAVDKMMDAVLGNNTGKASGVYGRFAATHSTENGTNIREFKELKGICLRKQYGMDLAIGGLGNAGIKGAGGVAQAIQMDGTCGHMYLHVNKGEKDKTSSLLIGFESDAPQKTNHMGHTHTSKAAQESMSNFLGQRADEMGDKYGGRTVDCTMYTAEELDEMVTKFTSHYRALMYKAIKDPSAKQRIEDTNKMLSGRLMRSEELRLCLNKAGLSNEAASTMSALVSSKRNDVVKESQERSFKSAIEKANDFFRNFRRGGRANQPQQAKETMQPQQTKETMQPQQLDEIKPMQEMKKPGLRTKIKAAFGNAEAKAKMEAYKQMIAKKEKSVRLSFDALDREEREATRSARPQATARQQAPQRENQKDKQKAAPALSGFKKK